MKSLLKFIGLRRLKEEKLRSFLTLFGIALGIALLTGIWLTSKSVINTFNRIVSQLRSTGDLYVNRRGLLFDQAAIKDVFEADPRDCAPYGKTEQGPCVEAALPIVLFFTLIEGSEEHVVIFSTDLLNAANVTRFQREFEFKQKDSDVENMSDLLFYPNAIVITSVLAEKLNLKINSHFNVLSVQGPVDLVVKGIIAPEGPAKMLDGNFALLPYQQAQRLLGVEGRILRIDIYLSPDMPKAGVSDQLRERVAKVLRDKLPQELLIDKHGDQIMLLEGGVLQGTEITLGLGIALALFAAMFMIYNTVSTSVVRRRREIGILRSLGVLRRQIAALFIGETIIMGLLGTSLGIAMGYYIERGAIALIHYRIHERFIKSFRLEIEPLRPKLIIVALAVGMAAAVFAAFFPARRATHVAPVEAMRRVPQVITRMVHPAWFFIAGVAFVLMSIYFGQMKPITMWGYVNEPIGAYAGLFFLFIGFIMMSPGVTLFATTVMRPLLLRLVGLEGGLASDNLRHNLPRASVTISALMLGLVMTVNQSAILESMKTTVNQWLDSIWNPDMVVMYGANAFGMMGLPINNSEIPKVRAIPEVADINGGMFIPFWHKGQMIDAMFEETSVTAKHNRYVFRGKPLPDYEKLLETGDGVLVTEVLALRTGLKTGDTLHIRTSRGIERDYKVVGVMADFISANGALILDRQEGMRNWGVDNVLGFDIYFKPGYKISEMPVRFADIDSNKLSNSALREFEASTGELQAGAGQGDGVWVAERFARKYRLRAGQKIQLRVDMGGVAVKDFTILGVVPDTVAGNDADALASAKIWNSWYSQRPGFLRRYYRKWMHGTLTATVGSLPEPDEREFVRSVRVGPDFMRQVFQRSLDASFGQNSHYGAFDPASIRKEVRRIMDVSFTTVVAIALVAIVVALLGIINTLLAAVIDRTRELGILRAIGGTRRQIRKTIIVEAAMMGTIAAILGTLAGILDSVMTIFYQGKFIVGWVLTYVFPTYWVIGIFIAAVVSAMFSGYYPARQATKMNIIEAIEYE